MIIFILRLISDLFIFLTLIPLLLYFVGPLLLLLVKSPRGFFWLSHGSLTIQILASLWWIWFSIVETSFASEAGGASASAQRIGTLIFWISILSIAITSLVWLGIFFEKIPMRFQWLAIFVSAAFPLLTMLPGHPVTTLAKNFFPEAKSAINIFRNHSVFVSQLKERAEKLRQEFDAGNKTVACEWLANDPTAPPEKFAACRELIESLEDPDARMEQINFFRPTKSQFGWFGKNKKFYEENRYWKTVVINVPWNEHPWMIRTLLETFTKVSHNVFIEQYSGVYRALHDALDSTEPGGLWNPAIKVEFAKFPKTELLKRAKQLPSYSVYVDDAFKFIDFLEGKENQTN